MTGYASSPGVTYSTSPLGQYEAAVRDPTKSPIERLQALAEYLETSIGLCEKQYPGDPEPHRHYTIGYGAAHGNAKGLLDDILRDVPPNIVQGGSPTPMDERQLVLLIKAQTALDMAEEFCVDPPPPKNGLMHFNTGTNHNAVPLTRAAELRQEADKLDRQAATAKMVRDVLHELRVHIGMRARNEG